MSNIQKGVGILLVLALVVGSTSHVGAVIVGTIVGTSILMYAVFLIADELI